ncbi:hypothetical protein BDZ88DRAFT_409217 [Geranomyces variabilis]|nr:hypothetical protein BDZ88DRAFT_409217 [Geranomyces variabilis]KAJ3139845.1 hypothetical protein HDU90_008743 [Geranomyces variabilis]
MTPRPVLPITQAPWLAPTPSSTSPSATSTLLASAAAPLQPPSFDAGFSLWGPGNIAFPDLDDFASLLASVSGSEPSPRLTSFLPTPESSTVDASLSAIPPPSPLTLNDIEALFAESLDDAVAPLSSPLSGGLGGSGAQDFIFADLLTAQVSDAYTPLPSFPDVPPPTKAPVTLALPLQTSAAGQPLSPISSGSHDEASASEMPHPKETSKRRKLTQEEKEQRAKERAIRNRQAAQDSRDKKRKYMEDLEATNAELARRLETTEQTNYTLSARLSQMAAQLESFRKRFKMTGEDQSDTLTLGALSSDPAAVRRQRESDIIQHGCTPSTKKESGRFVTPLTGSTTTATATLSPSSSNPANPQSPLTLKNSSASTQAHHPLATLVVTALFNSMVYLSTVSKTLFPLPSGQSTLGSGQTGNSVEGVNADAKLNLKTEPSGPVHKPGYALPLGLPRLDHYVAARQCSRLERFPVLQQIWSV